jgi:hypothetical protein
MFVTLLPVYLVLFPNTKQALGEGDIVCLFPEGFSRYHPTIAPLKTGIARIISDTLSAQRDNPDFEIYLLTCSVTYMYEISFSILNPNIFYVQASTNFSL